MSFKPNYVRSIIFRIGFISTVGICSAITYVFSFLFTNRHAYYLRWTWTLSVYFFTRYATGLSCQVSDPHKSLEIQAIFAFNHQSNWENFFCFYLTKTMIMPIAKIEMVRAHIIQKAMNRWGIMFIDREGSKQNLQSLRDDTTMLTKEYGNSIYICPEGTRKPVVTPYKSLPGVYFFYKALNLPVVPVAHDSGRYWRKFGTLQAGTIRLEVSKPIPPGLPKKEFLEKLDQAMNETIKRANIDNHRS